MAEERSGLDLNAEPVVELGNLMIPAHGPPPPPAASAQAAVPVEAEQRGPPGPMRGPPFPMPGPSGPMPGPRGPMQGPRGPMQGPPFPMPGPSRPVPPVPPVHPQHINFIDVLQEHVYEVSVEKEQLKLELDHLRGYTCALHQRAEELAKENETLKRQLQEVAAFFR